MARYLSPYHFVPCLTPITSYHGFRPPCVHAAAAVEGTPTASTRISSLTATAAAEHQGQGQVASRDGGVAGDDDDGVSLAYGEGERVVVMVTRRGDVIAIR